MSMTTKSEELTSLLQMFLKFLYSCEISGSHDGEYENDSLQGYGVV